MHFSGFKTHRNDRVVDLPILIDQIIAIDNSRFIKKIGILPSKLANTVKENLKIILDLE